MASSMSSTPPPQYLQPGTRALLVTGERRFLVAVLSRRESTLRVSFPMRDYPVAGMSVSLEFHEEGGYAAFECEVMETPKEIGDGLVLHLLRDNASETRHRGAWRVPAALPLQLKGHVHPRRHAGTAENVSALGMLVATDAHFEAGDNFDFTVTVAEDEVHSGTAQVMHLIPNETGDGLHRYGVRLVGADPDLRRAFARQVWRHVRRSYGLERGGGE